jgi:ABC-type lipoprotein release transport system permease subunit
MIYLIKLAFKNLTRYKKRTIITSLAIIFGMALYIIIDSMLVGVELESERNLFWYEVSMARVQHTEYIKEEKLLPLIYPVKNSEAIIDHLDKEGIKSAPRIDFRGEAIVFKDPYPEDGSMPVHCIGIDLVRDSDVYRIEGSMVEDKGRFLEQGDTGIIMGAKLAKNLGADVGYPLIIQTRTKDGTIQTIDTTIVGIFNTPNPPLNASALFMTIEMADTYLEMEGDVTSISMLFPESLDPDEESERLTESLKKSLGSDVSDVEVLSWTILASDYLTIVAAKRGGTSVMILIVMIIAGIGISNTMLMASYERINELSMMRALGMKDWRLKIVFIIEAAGIGLIGTIGALLLGAGLNYLLNTYGIDYNALFDMDFSEMDIGYRTTGVFYGVWKLSSYINVMVVGILLPMIVAWFPVRKTTKISIVEGLRHGGV